MRRHNRADGQAADRHAKITAAVGHSLSQKSFAFARVVGWAVHHILVGQEQFHQTPGAGAARHLRRCGRHNLRRGNAFVGKIRQTILTKARFQADSLSDIIKQAVLAERVVIRLASAITQIPLVRIQVNAILRMVGDDIMRHLVALAARSYVNTAQTLAPLWHGTVG